MAITFVLRAQLKPERSSSEGLERGATFLTVDVLGALFCQLHCLLRLLVHKNCEAGQVVGVFKITYLVAPPGIEPGTKT